MGPRGHQAVTHGAHPKRQVLLYLPAECGSSLCLYCHSGRVDCKDMGCEESYCRRRPCRHWGCKLLEPPDGSMLLRSFLYTRWAKERWKESLTGQIVEGASWISWSPWSELLRQATWPWKLQNACKQSSMRKTFPKKMLLQKGSQPSRFWRLPSLVVQHMANKASEARCRLAWTARCSRLQGGLPVRACPKSSRSQHARKLQGILITPFFDPASSCWPTWMAGNFSWKHSSLHPFWFWHPRFFFSFCVHCCNFKLFHWMLNPFCFRALNFACILLYYAHFPCLAK